MGFQIGVVGLELVLLAFLAAVISRRWLGAPPLGAWTKTAGNLLIYAAVVIFFASGFSKFAHFAPAVHEMQLLGLTGDRYYLVAAIELTSGLLLLIPPLRSLAILFVAAHVGGAISAHLIARQYFAILPSAVIVTVCCLGVFLRHPQALWSLSRTTSEPAAAAGTNGISGGGGAAA